MLIFKMTKFLTRGRTRKGKPHRETKEGGGAGLVAFHSLFFFLFEKKTRIFILMLFATKYVITKATDSCQTLPKCVSRIEKTATEDGMN